MGKKNNGAMHANQSFQQLVGQTNREALKPYIVEVVHKMGRDLEQGVATHLGNLNIKISALQKFMMTKMGLTKEEMVNLQYEVEDEATGHIATSDPAQLGDLVRLDLQIKGEKDADFNTPNRVTFQRVGVEPYQYHQAIETAVIGAKAGETVETSLLAQVGIDAEKNPVMQEFQVRLAIARVSRPPVQPTLQAVDATSEEYQEELTVNEETAQNQEGA